MTIRRPVTRWRRSAAAEQPSGQTGQTELWSSTERPDTLAVEEPLEIRLGNEPFTVTMRTPGHDLDLAIGFLLGEGIITGPHDVIGAMHCPDAAQDADGRPTYNVVEVALAPTAKPPVSTLPQQQARVRSVNSACGVCGTTSIEEIHHRSPYILRTDPVRIDAATLADLPRRLRVGQRTFDRTGGVHAAGLFTTDGELLCLREDVGRHNAVDKVIGWAVQRGDLPLSGKVLQVSGRASFELVQKAATAGIPILAAVSAPSSLAVNLASQMGLTLVGFSRESAFTAYTLGERITPAVSQNVSAHR